MSTVKYVCRLQKSQININFVLNSFAKIDNYQLLLKKKIKKMVHYLENIIPDYEEWKIYEASIINLNSTFLAKYLQELWKKKKGKNSCSKTLKVSKCTIFFAASTIFLNVSHNQSWFYSAIFRKIYPEVKKEAAKICP